MVRLISLFFRTLESFLVSYENVVYARNTVVRTIDFDVAADFVDKFHHQGMVKKVPLPHCFGLFSGDDLLGVAIFCPPRTKAKRMSYPYELLRLCFKHNTRVVGGASKLIKKFIVDKNPPSFFTYQDTSGKASKVYEKSGMTLVKKESPKKVVVKDGLTYDTAENNRRDWFSLQQVVAIGPDNLLKTSLGEVFHPSGKRMTNVELFTELLGYHLEEIPGDRVYEWHNPNMVFYTYKITAQDSDKYYYGRSSFSFKHKKPKEEELLHDGYYGSGGEKYKNWKRKHKGLLVKEILGVWDRWGESVVAEQELIGDLYKTDPLCLNSAPGGVSLSGASTKKPISIKECPIHGFTKHMGSHCYKCMRDKSIKSMGQKSHNKKTHIVKNCPIHGDVKHNAMTGECTYCLIASINRENKVLAYCPIHGVTYHQKSTCLKCSMADTYSTGVCLLHGEGSFKNGHCVACYNTKVLDIQPGHCHQHGDSLIIDGVCLECFYDKNVQAKDLLHSKTVLDNSPSKHKFVCPHCQETISSTVNNIIKTLWGIMDKDGRLPEKWTHHICKNCQKEEKFLTQHPEVVEFLTEEYVSQLSPLLTSTKDKRVFEFACPDCGSTVSSSTVRAFINKYKRKKGVMCSNN